MILALKHLITELIQRFLVSILAWPDFHLVKELIQRFLVSHPTRPDLPDEILVEIFSFLPAKSIGNFRCLSKTWRSSLSTRQFIKSHLARQNQENLILITPNLSYRSVETIRADCDNTVSREIKLPGLWDEILGSCDGLLLLMNADDESKVCLANPITQELVELPNIPLPPMSLRIIYGLGHDSVHDDYKVVAVCYYYYGPRSGKNVEENVAMEVCVYSVKSGVWTCPEYPYYSYYRWPVTPSGAYVNGAFHWSTVGRSNCRVIAAFDLATEVLFEIPTPSGVDVEILLSRAPVVLGGCLCAIDTRSNVKGIDVWVMKEYGVPESWTKFSVNECYLSKPLCFMRGQEEEVVLLVEGPCLVVCNVKDRMLRDLVVDGGFVDGCAVEERHFSYIDGCTFVESLVSPDPLCRVPKMKEWCAT